MIATALSNILKLFLPSWNFFNDFSAVPRLDVRTIHGGRESEWQPLYANTSTRSIRRVFFNADGNAELLEKTFIDRAAEEFASDGARAAPRPQRMVEEESVQTLQHPQQGRRAADGDRPRSDADNTILTRIVRSRLPATQPADEFQFRLVMTSPGEPDEVLLESARLPIQEDAR